MNNWQTKKLGEICELINRGISPKYTDSQGLRVLNQKCIRNNEVNFDLLRLHDFNSKRVSSDKFIQIGDVLVNSTGTGTLGRVAQVKELPFEATVDSHITIVRPIKNMFNNDFFGYALIFIEDEISKRGDGCGGQTELSRNTLKNDFEITYPKSLSEQQRIASILDKAFSAIDKAKSNVEQNLRNTKELFDSHLLNVFEMKDKGWDKKMLGEVAQHSLGKMLDKKKNQGIPQKYLRNQSVRWFEFDLSNLTEMPFLQNEKEKYTAIKGDILICEGGYPGRAAIWQEDYPIYFQKAIHRVRFHNNEYNTWFLYYLFILDRTNKLKNHFTGTGIQHLTGEALDKLIVPIPPLNKLTNIINQFNILHAEAKKIEAIYLAKIEKLKAFKKSILQKAFSGKLTNIDIDIVTQVQA